MHEFIKKTDFDFQLLPQSSTSKNRMYLNQNMQPVSSRCQPVQKQKDVRYDISAISNNTPNIVQFLMNFPQLLNDLCTNAIPLLPVDRQSSITQKIYDLKQSPDSEAKKLLCLTNIINEYSSDTNDFPSTAYECILKYYGIQVNPYDSIVSRQSMEIHYSNNDGFNIPPEDITEEYLHQLFIRDKKNIIDDLNSLYQTPTGNQLLQLIAEGTAKGKTTSIYVGFNIAGVSTDFIHPHNTRFQDTNGQIPGSGSSSLVCLTSHEQQPFLLHAYNEAGIETIEEPLIVLAHELIHVLHAQKGVRPSENTALWFSPPSSEHVGSIDLDSWLDFTLNASDFSTILSQYKDIFFNATPDDIPTTGILYNQIRYPEPLNQLRHIHENAIRRELNMKLREKY